MDTRLGVFFWQKGCHNSKKHANCLCLKRKWRRGEISTNIQSDCNFRITENTSGGKEGERSTKASPTHDRKPVHVETVSKSFQLEQPPAKNSLHIEVNLPLPPATAAAKQASVSPGHGEAAEAKILQLSGVGEGGAGAGKPCVVIPPPPSMEPPPPPADFVPLQHSASAPNFNNRSGEGTWNTWHSPASRQVCKCLYVVQIIKKSLWIMVNFLPSK